MSTDSESESNKEVARSIEEEDKTENGYLHEENGNSNEEGTPASRRSPGRASKSASLFSLAFPISRVRKLVKSEGDIQWVGVEAGFLIAKAAELFLEKFVEDSFDRMQDNHCNSIAYPDLSSHVASSERLEFLTDFVPEKVQAASVLYGKDVVEK